MGQDLSARDTIGLQGRLTVGLAVGLRVVLVEPTHAVHLVVDAAGDVL